MSDQVPEGWEEKTLDAMVSVDGESLKGNTDPNFSFKYIDISCVSTGAVKPPTEQIMFKDAPSRAKRIVRRNDVLVATVRPNLKAFAHFDYEGDGWVASTGFAVLRHNEKSNSRFIYNTMLSDDVSKQIDRLVAGSNYPAINSSDIKELTLLSPPLNEQKKIASILTSVDEVIETTQKQIDKLQDLKKATMNELLTKGIGHTEFKDSELGRIPKSWEVLTVSDYVDVGRGYAFKTADFSNSGNPIIRVTNISAGNRLDLSKNVFYLDCDRSEEFKKFRLNDEDFLLVMVGATVGKYALVETFGKEVFLNQNMWRLRVRDQKRHEQKYAGYALQMVVDRFLKTSQGSARDFLTQKEFGSALVATPKLGEQKKVQEILDIIVAQQRNLSIKLSQTQSLKKSLMQDLLTGKVRVQVN